MDSDLIISDEQLIYDSRSSRSNGCATLAKSGAQRVQKNSTPDIKA